MFNLLLAEILAIGIVLYLATYFYQEHTWQKWIDSRLEKAANQPKKSGAIPDPSKYKTDEVVY